MIEEYKEFIWFFAGVFAYRTLTAIMVYGHMHIFVKGVTDQSLKMLGAMAEDIGFIKEVKYKHMSESGASNESIQLIKETDERSFNVWKSVCISHMLVNYPQPYRRQIKLEDWDTAMQELDRIYKYESKKKKS